MLVSLSIRNIVLIEKLDLELKSGLTVLTGETGAGKSILLDALSLALGERSDVALIRKGETLASVSVEFDITNKCQAVQKILSDNDIILDNSQLILKRTLNSDGKSKAFLNDAPITIGLLKQIGSALVEIHGQFANHQLLDESLHQSLLDNYGNLQKDLSAVASLWEAYKNYEQKKNELITKITETKK